MTFEEFVEAAEKAVEGLPDHVRCELDNVAFFARKGRRGGPLGEYIGTPQLERIGDTSGLLPDRIFVYYNAICDECDGNGQAMLEEIQRTLWHEIAHHLGWDDHRIEEMERSRGWRDAS